MLHKVDDSLLGLLECFASTDTAKLKVFHAPCGRHPAEGGAIAAGKCLVTLAENRLMLIKMGRFTITSSCDGFVRPDA